VLSRLNQSGHFTMEQIQAIAGLARAAVPLL